jgi:hypothetical protein
MKSFWTLGQPPLAYRRRLTWAGQGDEEVGQFERPQLLFDEDGSATHMIAATAYSEGELQGVTDSWVSVVPLGK